LLDVLFKPLTTAARNGIDALDVDATVLRTASMPFAISTILRAAASGSAKGLSATNFFQQRPGATEITTGLHNRIDAACAARSARRRRNSRSMDWGRD
jgi:predicted permease